MRRLLTATIVFVLAIVLVSPLVEVDDAGTSETHEHAVLGQVRPLVTFARPGVITLAPTPRGLL